jgi:glycosyltransferase involved in cell wall biosynthesis
MRIALLALKDSIHAIRWANSLSARGHEIDLISMHTQRDSLNSQVIQHDLKMGPPFGYFLNVWKLKNILKEIQPDILHAHYASGYGTLARLSHFHPLIISVWGSDVFDFPLRSPLHRRILVDNLCAADWICSTSTMMAKHTTGLTDCVNDRISIVPFGIDCDRFRSFEGFREPDNLTIGTVKTMASKYGIDTLIHAFAKLYYCMKSKKPLMASKLRLVLVGGRPSKSRDDQTEELKKLAEQLGIQRRVNFVGQVQHSHVPEWLNRFDIYVALSRLDSESFGVAVLEASACELPVVVSNVGGLPDVVQDGVTGYVVPKENPALAAETLYKLAVDPALREVIGKNGRNHVVSKYDWEKNVTKMEKIYYSIK